MSARPCALCWRISAGSIDKLKHQGPQVLGKPDLSQSFVHCRGGAIIPVVLEITPLACFVAVGGPANAALAGPTAAALQAAVLTSSIHGSGLPARAT